MEARRSQTPEYRVAIINKFKYAFYKMFDGNLQGGSTDMVAIKLNVWNTKPICFSLNCAIEMEMCERYKLQTHTNEKMANLCQFGVRGGGVHCFTHHLDGSCRWCVQGTNQVEQRGLLSQSWKDRVCENDVSNPNMRECMYLASS